MNIKIQKNDILELLSKVQNIVERKNHVLVLTNILLEALDNKLKVYATNLEVSLIDECECKVLEKGKSVLNAKNLYNIIRELEEQELSIKKESNDWLTVKQKKSLFEIPTIAPDNFPIFPKFSIKKFTSFNAENFLNMIDKTIFSISNDKTRHYLTGSYFTVEEPKKGQKYYTMVSTDAIRLSYIRTKVQDTDDFKFEGEGFIIPKKGLVEVKKLIEFDKSIKEFLMAFDNSQLIFRFKDTTLIIRLIEGKYPNYKSFITPKIEKQNHVQSKKNVLLSSIKRVSLLSEQDLKKVIFTFSKNKMIISSNNPKMGNAKEEIPLTYEGSEVSVGFNANFLIDALSSINDEEVSFFFESASSPGMFKINSNTDYRYVFMPIRI